MNKKTKPFTVVHTADLHFSIKQSKLDEVVRVTDFMLDEIKGIAPDLTILAGDTVDEFDGHIRIDSQAARSAISFVLRLADISPVAIVIGTASHDGKTPELFGKLKGKYPIYVATCIEQVGLFNDGKSVYFKSYTEETPELQALLTFLPSPDKSKTMALFGHDTQKLATMAAKDLFVSEFKSLGDKNSIVKNSPRIVIGHGMITGASYSSGVTSIGEDLEYDVNTLLLINADYYAFGHIHKSQSFPGNIAYSGSPGRLNLGETEDKTFSVVIFEERKPVISKINTPAKNISFFEFDWSTHDAPLVAYDVAYKEFIASGVINEADVRVRIKIPEEERQNINRDKIIQDLISCGALSTKVDIGVIPKERQRAAGISILSNLPEKVKRWGEVSNTVISERVLNIVSLIEGKDIEELISEARENCNQQEIR